MGDLDELAADVATAESVVAFTGAGISAPSGVPTFRGDDGVWDRFDEGDFHYDRFLRDPTGFWRDRLDLHEAMHGDGYEPNAAHEALAALGRAGCLDAIVTQNTDGLHERAADGANAPELLELHGNAHRVICVDCGRRDEAGAVFDEVREAVADGGADRAPRCDCGGLLKPDVVLFGEQLPRAVLQRARSLARESGAFLAIGSSLVVEPAASLPHQAAATGATLAIVNLEETPHDDRADHVFREDVTTALPRLRAAVLEDAGDRAGPRSR